MLAAKFQKWNSSVFRNQDRKLADIESEIHMLEAEGERRHLVDSEVEELGRLNSEVNVLRQYEGKSQDTRGASYVIRTLCSFT